MITDITAKKIMLTRALKKVRVPAKMITAVTAPAIIGPA